MLRFIRSHPSGVAATAMVVLAGLAWLAFGYFGVHTLFVDDVVSEAAPVFDAPAPADEPTSSAPTSSGPTTTAPAATAPVTSPPADDETSGATTPIPTTTVPAAPEIVVEFDGAFMDESRYSTDGQAVVLGNGTGQRFLRFEEFETDNGPDLNVYLVNSSTGDVSDFVDLGDLKGNIGEQNYEIPPDVDLTVYDRVVIWCVRFGVGFGSATLSMA